MLISQLQNSLSRVETKISITQRRLARAIRCEGVEEQARLQDELAVLRQIRDRAEDALVLIAGRAPHQTAA